MLRSLIALVICMLLLSGAALAAEVRGFTFGTDPQVSQMVSKKPVRVKVRRLSGGEYTWEVTGDDVEEVIRAEEALKQHYGSKK